MDLRICGQHEAPDIGIEFEPTYLVSLLNPGETPHVPESVTRHLHIACRDVLDGWGAPRLGHVQRIVRFTGLIHDSSRVLVCCHAGISRSTAVAAGILTLKSGSRDFDGVFQHIQKIRPVAQPNPLLIGLFDDALGMEGCFEASFYKVIHGLTNGDSTARH